MPTFKDELAARGWMLKSGNRDHQPPFTHLFLDGGRAAVPDSMHGVFLNLYTNAILRGERVFAVEAKTSNFKLFFDIDARYAGDPDTARKELFDVVEFMNVLVSKFWDAPSHPKAILCEAPIKSSKDDGDDTFKIGLHVHWPGIVTNSPIALAFRSHVIEAIKGSDIHMTSLNTIDDILDACVFKANGLRLVYSGKIDEYRAYTPIAVISQDGFLEIPPVTTADSKRKFVHETSIRAFDVPLTPCKNGIDKLADESTFAHARHRIGTQSKLEEYTDVIPKLQALLPKVYETQRFTGVFRTEHMVMFKSTSRYCHNVEREHRTSTVYFVVARRGLAQRCYCRKDDHGCVDYCSDWIHVPEEILDRILPQPGQPDEMIHVMPSKKRSVGNLHCLLSRCKPCAPKKKSVKKRPKK